MASFLADFTKRYLIRVSLNEWARDIGIFHVYKMKTWIEYSIFFSNICKNVFLSSILVVYTGWIVYTLGSQNLWEKEKPLNGEIIAVLRAQGGELIVFK